MQQTLSIIIPLFNEENTILEVLEKVAVVELVDGLKKELLVVDDCSDDKSFELVDDYIKRYPSMSITLLSHDKNKGKGAALHTGIKSATGDFLIIQDADLEYNPNEYNDLLKPMLQGHADVVYGTRFSGSNPHRILFFWHSIGNKFLTWLSNMFTNLNLTDMETCYKLFRMEVIKKLNLREKRFGFEPEVTAKASSIKGVRIYEVGISYYGRSYAEGKKIHWQDGIHAIYCIFRYNLFG